MKYPQLVPPWVCKIPVKIVLQEEGLTEDGEPIADAVVTTFCNYQDGGRSVLTGDQKRIETSGRIYLTGDIAPNMANITGGQVTIFGETREIAQAFKRRNPDGTVNFTEVILK